MVVALEAVEPGAVVEGGWVEAVVEAEVVVLELVAGNLRKL